MGRILIIEDNSELAAGIRHNLEIEGYTVEVALDGQTGLERVRQQSPDLVILDLMLPGMHGFDVLEAIRKESLQTQVLILSARGDEADIVRGFRLDADQYVTKPFRLLELLERVKSMLRRGEARPNAPRIIEFGDIVVDTASRTVSREGEPVSLTPKAYKLLCALVQRGGAVASRNELLREVWGHRGFVPTRTVDSHMAEIRRKLEADPAHPRHFVTVWKVGYRFEA
jgi:two-component system response regulator MtrA